MSNFQPIPYEQFEAMLNAILSIQEEVSGLNNVLKDYFDGHAICTIGSEQIDILIEQLEIITAGKLKVLADGREWSDLEWWIYETGCGAREDMTKVTYSDGTEKNIKTKRDLYDSLTEKL